MDSELFNQYRTNRITLGALYVYLSDEIASTPRFQSILQLMLTQSDNKRPICPLRKRAALLSKTKPKYKSPAFQHIQLGNARWHGYIRFGFHRTIWDA